MSHTPKTATTIRATGVLKIPDIAKKIYLPREIKIQSCSGLGLGMPSVLKGIITYLN